MFFSISKTSSCSTYLLCCFYFSHHVVSGLFYLSILSIHLLVALIHLYILIYSTKNSLHNNSNSKQPKLAIKIHNKFRNHQRYDLIYREMLWRVHIFHMGQSGLFFVYFKYFQSNDTILQQTNVKNVHQVSSSGNQTLYFRNKSLLP